MPAVPLQIVYPFVSAVSNPEFNLIHLSGSRYHSYDFSVRTPANFLTVQRPL